MRPLVALAVAAMVLAVFPAVSPAPTTPKNCGSITVGGKRVKIRADQLRCKKARKGARGYMNGKGAPNGFDCTRYGAGTSVEFICAKGQTQIIAIRT